MNKIFAFILVVLVLSCTNESKPETNCYNDTDPPRNSHKETIEQGVWGDVWFWSGDFMPIGRGEICQVKRKVLVYELTTFNDVEQSGHTPFYSEINTNLVTTIESDRDGFFQIELEPGTYSLFVQEDGGYYSNLYTSEGIFPVTIEPGKVSEVRFDITYKATF